MGVEVTSHAVMVHVLREGQKDPEVLLLHRSFPPICWSEIGGGVEEGETAWQAGLREMHEETGLVPLRYYSADFCQQYYDPDDDRICLFPVFVAYVDPLAEVALNHEHDAFRWVSFHEAMELVPYPGQRRALGMIRETFVVRAPHPILLIDTSHS